MTEKKPTLEYGKREPRSFDDAMKLAGLIVQLAAGLLLLLGLILIHFHL